MVAGEVALALACIPDLSTAAYPPEAVAARIQGTVNISFRFDPDGRPSGFETSAHPLLAEGAAKAMRAAPPLPHCAGERSAWQIVFALTDHTPAEQVKRHAEKLYEIQATAPTIETVIADPAWTFSRRGRFLHRIRGWLGRLLD